MEKAKKVKREINKANNENRIKTCNLSTRSVKQQNLIINSEQSESKKTLDSHKPPSEKVFTTQSGCSESASQMYPIIGSLQKR